MQHVVSQSPKGHGKHITFTGGVGYVITLLVGEKLCRIDN